MKCIRDDVIDLSVINAHYYVAPDVAFVIDSDSYSCTYRKFKSIEDFEKALSMHLVDRVFYVHDIRYRQLAGELPCYWIRYCVKYIEKNQLCIVD